MILGTIWGKNSAIFGKFYLLYWDFSADWECPRSTGNFFSQLGKIWKDKKPCSGRINKKRIKVLNQEMQPIPIHFIRSMEYQVDSFHKKQFSVEIHAGSLSGQ